MIDFAKRLRIFSEEGFDMGYFVGTSNHVEFKLINTAKDLRIDITICFHETVPKYFFRLVADSESIYERKVETDGEMMMVSGEICNKVRGYTGAEDKADGDCL